MEGCHMIRFSGNMKKLKLCRILIINYYCWLIVLLVQKIGIAPSFHQQKRVLVAPGE